MQRDQVVNLTAGPSALPLPVLEEAAKGLINYEGTGMGITELSHRSPEFTKLSKDLAEIIRNHLQVPETHSVLFVQGGGSQQFSAVVLNLLARHRRLLPDLPEEQRVMDYVVTGSWSSKAADEARRIGGKAPVHIVQDARTSSASGDAFESIPAVENWNFSSKPAFVYYCDNETVDGVQFDGYLSRDGNPASRVSFPFDSLPRDPTDASRPVPLVADYSSSFFSRPIPRIEDHALIYAGAQKNIGPAGLTILIARYDILAPSPPKSPSNIPTTLDYSIIDKSKSLYNTPPMFSMYVALLVMRHFEAQGGLPNLATANLLKAEKVYAALSAGEAKGVFRFRVKNGSRSYMNVVFEVLGEGEEDRFLKEATAKGFRGVKGHRSVGGIRVSLYNAVTTEQVDKLVSFLNEYVAKASRKLE